jgi:hypothetical protein
VKSVSFTMTTKDASLYDIDTASVSGLSTTAGSLDQSCIYRQYVRRIRVRHLHGGLYRG